MSDEAYREAMLRTLQERIADGSATADAPIVKALHYHPGDAADLHAFTR